MAENIQTNKRNAFNFELKLNNMKMRMNTALAYIYVLKQELPRDASFIYSSC